MNKIIRDLLIGPVEEDYSYKSTAIETQKNNIRAVWRNSKDATFGIERLARLALASSSFLFPGLYIRHYAGKKKLLWRKLAVEVYVCVKLFFPIFILSCGIENSVSSLLCVAYFGVETILYNLGLLFLSDIYVEPISYKRSYLMTMMNFAEINLDFAVLYKGIGSIDQVWTAVDAVYFSNVTAFTVGYGDMRPTSDLGKALVIAQSACSLLIYA